MIIPKHELEKMDQLLATGMTIAAIARKYPKYDYWVVYESVSDFSLRGKKYKITSKLSKLKSAGQKLEREKLIGEIKELVSEIYEQSKANGKKLNEIAKVLGK